MAHTRHEKKTGSFMDLRRKTIRQTYVELQARLLQLEQILSKKLLKINVTLFGPIKL